MKDIQTLMLNIGAVGGSMAGSLAIAANIGLGFYGYVAFTVSSVCSAIVLARLQEVPKALLFQNLFFTVVNLFGLARYF